MKTILVNINNYEKKLRKKQYLGISHASPRECHNSVSLLVTQFIKRLIASLVSNGDTTLDGMFGLYCVS